MALIEGYTLINEPIEVRRIHVRIAHGIDRIEALLISDNENYIWACVTHV
jgi:hypothetical protein